MGSISLNGINKSFGSTEVLKNINLDIKDGEFLILIGPSGCGKSTLMNLIAGLEELNAGEIVIDGKDVSGESPKDRDIAMVFQSYALYPTMNVARNICFGLEMNKVPKSEQESILKRVSELLQIDHLLDRKPGQLSGGQRQRLSIARAIAKDSPILILDEATSALDSATEKLVQSAITKMQKGRTTIIIAHRLSTIQNVDRIIVLNEGEIIEQGSHKELIKASGEYAKLNKQQL